MVAIIKQVGKAQRIQVHAAYIFHALMAIGSALRSKSGASISALITGLAFGGIFSTFGIAFVRKPSGMVKFAPQYVHVMRVIPAAGSLGPPQAEQLNCVI